MRITELAVDDDFAVHHHIVQLISREHVALIVRLETSAIEPGLESDEA